MRPPHGRRPYIEYLAPPTDPSNLSEAWFAGVHSDVGGTFTDGDVQLSTIALKWMTDGALEEGLLLKNGAYEQACRVDEAHARVPQHRMGWVWALATYRHRPLPPEAWVHASVQARVAATDYQLSAPVRDDRWADKHWTTLSRLAP